MRQDRKQQSPKTLTIILARGGSKRLPGKNIKLLCGKPLIAYAIEAALKAKLISRVIVSTDDKKIAQIARQYGAEVPFRRPARLASDRTTSLNALLHAVKFLEKKEKTIFDIIVLIQVTTPFVTSQDIDTAIEVLLKTNTKSCVSVCEIAERPEWMYVLRRQRAKPFVKFSRQNQPSHFLPKVYRLNGAVYVVRRKTLIEQKKLSDITSMSAIVMPKERSVDIEDELDFTIVKTLMKRRNHDKKN